MRSRIDKSRHRSRSLLCRAVEMATKRKQQMEQRLRLGSKIKKGEGRVQDSCFAMTSPLDYLIFN